ncbi:MAG: thioredoxin family protein [Nitrososphaerales archaeon]
MPRVVELTSQNFDRILRSSRKLFVDFWAPWCKPCMNMNPLIERMADKHSSITFAKVNVEDYGDLATRYHISSIPAYMMFSNSSPEFSKIGSVSETELEKMIYEHA